MDPRNRTTALGYACRAGHLDMTATLLYTHKNAGSTVTGVTLASPDWANQVIRRPGVDVNHQCGSQQYSPLHLAALAGAKDLLAVLVRAGADLEARCSLGWTPLLTAAGFCRDQQVAITLVELGSSIRASDGDGFTALFHAAGTLKFDLTKKLLELGADPNAIAHNERVVMFDTVHNERRFTPLEAAIAPDSFRGGQRGAHSPSAV